GFSNPYWVDTGPTAEVAPVLPYLVAGVMAIFGIYTKAAAVAVLTLNSLVSALTCVPIFFLEKELWASGSPLGRLDLGVFSLCGALFRRLNVGPCAHRFLSYVAAIDCAASPKLD